MLSPFDTLPDELLFKIFSYVAIPDLVFSVEHVSRRWRNLVKDPSLWRKFVFVCDNKRSADGIMQLLSQIPLLYTFCLKGPLCVEEEKKVLKAVFEHCKSLRTLILQNANITEYTLIDNMFENLKELRVLHIDCISSYFKTDDFYYSFKQCTHLKKLSLLPCTDLQDFHLRAIVDGCEILEELDITGAAFVSDIGVLYLLEQRKNTLVNLKLNGFKLTDVSFIKLSSCKRLEVLEVKYCRAMNIKGLHAIGKLHLKSLLLDGTTKITPDDMCKFFKEGKMSNLLHLDLSSYDSVNDKVTEIIAFKCVYLQSLCLYSAKITDDGIINILKGCKFLERLVITGIDSLKGEFLRFVPIFGRSLKYLKMDIRLRYMLRTLTNYEQTFQNLRIEY